MVFLAKSGFIHGEKKVSTSSKSRTQSQRRENRNIYFSEASTSFRVSPRSLHVIANRGFRQGLRYCFRCLHNHSWLDEDVGWVEDESTGEK